MALRHGIMILCLLFVTKCGYGNGLDESNVAAHIERFFSIDDLGVGKPFTVKLKVDGTSSSSHLLSKEEADSLPFSLSELPNILQLLSIPRGSTRVKAMQDTLRGCESEPIQGEAKACATSVESLLEFVHTIFGPKTEVKVLTTTHDAMSIGNSNRYTIMDFKEIPIRKLIGCHPMPYPYKVYHCHHQFDSETKAFRILLKGNDGDRFDTYAACHMDTTNWNPNHISFRVLNTKPGSSPVCHIFPEGHLLWVQPKSNMDHL
ncbi:BURP domain-containing protein BNM2A-like [Tripterygium wilfordii]|uniref:BURP domain-containing protein BNM2A-like n=1 Tax=Tripterygium wilfordii TaxID=458696 RepID=UPI0018F7EDBA|nr:BURP domain-containing protein BNM2A-like [Tripterygium wilfordii]